ncbi:MAG: GLUG motif-containing protein [Comamonas sp.]|uniref:GLUG motif-containing protein n=1 Tax=Comamonas sp. TaxID=34028 RepID=UPI002FCA33AE
MRLLQSINVLLPLALAAAQALVVPVHARDPEVKFIHGVEELQALRDQPDGHYALAGPIDASATAGWNHGAGFAPIGRDGAPFTGSFDGRGHAIHGLFIERPGEAKVGLFGHARNATLRNVRLVGGQVTGGENVGALVGHLEAAGGEARIDRVCAQVTVTASGTAGGLVGHSESHRGSSLISRSHAGGAVRAAGSNVGGLVGHNEAYDGSATITRAYASGEIAGGDYVGGLVGYNDALRGISDISDSHASGAVRARAEVAGGLVGLDTGGRIAHSFYATTDGQGRAINRFAAASGTGLRLEQLLLTPAVAVWHGKGCQGVYMTDR